MNRGIIFLAIAGIVAGIAAGYWLADFNANEQTSSKIIERKILYWVAPMDPNFRRDQPGKSPMGMDLIPVYEDSAGAETPGILISPAMMQNLGIRTTIAQRRNIAKEIKAVGIIVPDDDLVHRLNLRSEGWIESASVTTAGVDVASGEVLFLLFAPRLLNAQAEYLQALRLDQPELVSAARQRLIVLGMGARQIQRISRTGTPDQNIEISAPQSGTVVELNVRSGQFVKPDNPIMTVADLSRVWVMVEILESDISGLVYGDRVKMSVTGLPGRIFSGSIDYVYPVINADTRTAKVRLSFPNPDRELRPNMFADIRVFSAPVDSALTVPRESVIRTEHSTRVILDLGGGRFRPATVVTGLEAGSDIEIVEGLREGDKVVVSGQFLIDSEASLDAAFTRLGGRDDTSRPEAISSQPASIIGEPQ